MNNRQSFFEKLVSAYAKDLYRYAYWLSKDATIAEDLVQECFARAWKSIDSLKDEKAAKSWLITILRRENARRFEKHEPLMFEVDENLVWDDQHNEPYTRFEQQQLRQRMMQLPQEYQEPLMLQVIWGFKGEEIAEQLDLKLATVNTRLHRARQQLKQMMSEREKNNRHATTGERKS